MRKGASTGHAEEDDHVVFRDGAIATVDVVHDGTFLVPDEGVDLERDVVEGVSGSCVLVLQGDSVQDVVTGASEGREVEASKVVEQRLTLAANRVVITLVNEAWQFRSGKEELGGWRRQMSTAIRP